MLFTVTRAVRTPSRVERDFTTGSLINPATPLFVTLFPDESFDSEQLIAYEAGYRRRLGRRVYLTVAAFYNDHDELLSTEAGATFAEPGPPPRAVLPVTFGNGLHGEGHGLETTADVDLQNAGRLSGSYSYLRINITKSPGSTDVSQEIRGEGLSPRHQAQVRWALTFARDWTLDAALRHVSSLPAGPVPDYTTADVRLARRFDSGIELSVSGRNLLQAHHLEVPGGSAGNVEVERSVLAGVTWRK
jgi:iron complex outermembrane receptor protein